MISFQRTLERDPGALERGAALLAALAHPVRLHIVDGLVRGNCGVGDMIACLGLPQPLVSRHLAVLRRAGIVAARREGRRRIYRVVDPQVRDLVVRLLDELEGDATDERAITSKPRERNRA